MQASHMTKLIRIGESAFALQSAYVDGSGIVADSELVLAILRDPSVALGDAYVQLRKRDGILRVLDAPEIRHRLSQLELVKAGDDRSRAIRFELITNVHVVHRGFIEAFTPLLINLPSDPMVVHFKTKPIDGERDWIAAEDHDGRHYHYCLQTGVRTDVVLNFDVANALVAHDTKSQKLKPHSVPLFWEKHGRGKNNSKPGRPDLWGAKKRKSIHSAISPDLEEQSITFRRPSQKADNVWPLKATLSPAPS